MAEARLGRLRALFDAALDLPDGEVEAWLRAQCRDAPELADEVLRLLARDREHEGTGGGRLAATDLSGLLGAAMPESVVEGRQVGAFRIISLIGAGGMGRVYRAERCDGQVEQQVAVKLVRQEALNPALLKRFSSEQQVLASLDHPGICRFIDAGLLSEGTPYVLMELVDGVPIFDYCDRHGLGIEARLRLFRKVLAAVDHAHRSLVIHRDIKSGNVLVTSEGEAKLLDFGIAKALDGTGMDSTATVERYLTPRNAAPEQLGGAPVGTACDVYALGLLLYELLAGSPAFGLDGLSVEDAVQCMLHQPAEAPSRRAAAAADEVAITRGLASAPALARRLRGDLDAIVLRCLRKAPTERYAGAGELDAEIGRHLDGYPIRVRHSERWYRTRRYLHRHRTAVALSALLVLTMVSALVAIATQAIALAAERNRAIVERDRAQHAVEMLRDAFSGADPGRVAGANVSAGQVLESARERIEALADDQPELFATLAATIAEVELDLGRHAQAEALAGRALDVSVKTVLPLQLRRSLLLVLGRAATGNRRYPLAELSLAQVRSIDGADHADYLIAKARLLLSSDPDQAIALLEEASTRLEDATPDNFLATQVHWLAAQAHREAGRHAEGADVLDRTLAWQHAALDADHPRIALTRIWRSDLLRSAGHPEAAIDEAQQALAAVVARYGVSSAMAARARFSLAAALQTNGQYDQAVDEYRQVVADYRRALGASHSDTVRVVYNLGTVLERYLDRSVDAEAIYREAIADIDRSEGSGTVLAAVFRLEVHRMLATRGLDYESLDTLLPEDVPAEVHGWPSEMRARYARALADAGARLRCEANPPVASRVLCDRVDLFRNLMNEEGEGG